MNEWTETLDDLTAYLHWQQERGVRFETFDPATIRAFYADAPARSPAPAGRPAAPAPAAAASDRAPSAAPDAPRQPPVPLAQIVVSATTPEGRVAALETLARAMAGCTRCALHRDRTRTVPGQGQIDSPDVMFIGEAPGADEDAQGLAFVGAAGQLLTKMIVAMGYTRDEVFIGNICKCRPPGNRPPAPDEMQTCLPFLKAQIALIRPKTIVALGATAVKGLLDDFRGISKMRGTWTQYAGIPLMPTFHPAYLLRQPGTKKDSWNDLKLVLKRLGRQAPAPKKQGPQPSPAAAPQNKNPTLP